MARSDIKPLVAIVGETASGKSAAAIKLALQLNGEIICADSRTIYQGMDIGTAKPSPAERAQVPHHLLDIITPDKPFNAADFKQRAEAAIADIYDRRKLPIIVGGTGLYVDALLYDYQFRAAADPVLREKLNRFSVDALQQLLHKQGIPLPENERNPRHLIRAIETGGQTAKRGEIRPHALIVGIRLPREEIIPRIRARVEAMLASGLEQEVQTLAEQYGWEAPGLQTIGYQEWRGYFAGNQTLEETQNLILKNSLAYAKRQRTWFRRNNSIQWVKNRGDITKIVVRYTSELNK